MIFLTVGTQFPFDRLVKAVDKAVDEGLIDEEILAQTGDSKYQPRNFKSVTFLDKQMFDERLRSASSVISHAGMGNLAMALDYGKPILVMPRLKKDGEVVNDHQTAIAKKFEELGHILVAYREEDLPDKIGKLKSFVPQPRKNGAKAVVERISRFLTQVNKAG